MNNTGEQCKPTTPISDWIFATPISTQTPIGKLTSEPSAMCEIGQKLRANLYKVAPDLSGRDDWQERARLSRSTKEYELALLNYRAHRGTCEICIASLSPMPAKATIERTE